MLIYLNRSRYTVQIIRIRLNREIKKPSETFLPCICLSTPSVSIKKHCTHFPRTLLYAFLRNHAAKVPGAGRTRCSNLSIFSEQIDRVEVSIPGQAVSLPGESGCLLLLQLSRPHLCGAFGGVGSQTLITYLKRNKKKEKEVMASLTFEGL